MIPMIEQMRRLEEQVEALKDQFGRPPAPPPPRIPQARCTSQSFGIARLIGGRLGPVRDDELFTKISVTEEAHRIAQRAGLPIRFLSWEVDPTTVTGPDAVCIVESLHVATDDGDNGRRPVHTWKYLGAPPTWLKFNNTEVFA
jgi:hypothetical protein